jgi:hypothetical protein
MIFDASKHRFLRRLEIFGKFVLFFFPFLKHDIAIIYPDIKPSLYMASVFFNSLFFSSFFVILVFSIFGYSLPSLLYLISFIYILVFSLAFYIIHPKAKSIDIKKETDRDLGFLLKDLLIQLKSGINLYDALISAGNANYGIASQKIKDVVKKINQGYNERVALQEIITTIKSDFMKTTLWRIVSSLRTGGNIGYLLNEISGTLKNYHEEEMRRYIEITNIALIGFLLLGCVLPSIAIISSIVIFSVLGLDFSSNTLFSIFGFSFVLQVFLIGYIHTSRPSLMR